jgi:hypothetical protein
MNNNKLNEYKNWLELKNFTPETIEKYLWTLRIYGERELNTVSIINFLRNNLTKYEPNTLKGQKNALASYAKFLRIYDDLEWELVSKIIPRIQKRPFPILN